MVEMYAGVKKVVLADSDVYDDPRPLTLLSQTEPS